MPVKHATAFALPEKKAWREIAQERGLWEQFISLREDLKKRDVSGSSAWIQAARQLGWIHHENPKSGHMRGEKCEVCAQFGEGDQDVVVEKGPTIPLDKEQAIDNIVAAHNAKTGSYAARDMVLMPKAMADEKPRQDISTDIEWVVEQLAIEGVTPADAPSARAWSLYSIAKVSQLGLQMVLQHHKSMMPTGKQLESESGFGDLGAKKLEEFSNFLDSEEHVGLLGADALQLQSAENTSAERVVSKANLEARRRK